MEVRLSSVGKIKNIAKHVADNSKNNRILSLCYLLWVHQQCNISLASKISKYPDPRDYDLLVSTGEQVSITLLSLALKELGVDCVAYTGWQAGISNIKKAHECRIKKILILVRLKMI